MLPKSDIWTNPPVTPPSRLRREKGQWARRWEWAGGPMKGAKSVKIDALQNFAPLSTPLGILGKWHIPKNQRIKVNLEKVPKTKKFGSDIHEPKIICLVLFHFFCGTITKYWMDTPRIFKMDPGSRLPCIQKEYKYNTCVFVRGWGKMRG